MTLGMVCVGFHNVKVIRRRGSEKWCATTRAKLHAQFHFGSFYTAFRKQGSSTGGCGEPWRQAERV